VWRRVRCTLTSNHLAYAFRWNSKSRGGRLALPRALLIANSDAATAPPFTFCIVSVTGQTHLFQALSRATFAAWMRVIQCRILESFENSLLDQADLLAADESHARNQRMASVAAEPFYENMVAAATTNKKKQVTTGHVGSVLRWGMHVAEYRECCRYVTSKLPAKIPVVVSVVGISEQRQESTSSSGSTKLPESLDPQVKDLNRICWNQASALLARATHISSQLHPDKKLSRSIETLCRHADYVITGRRFGTNNNNNNNNNDDQESNISRNDHHGLPPPMDLFDLLLMELQHQVAGPAAARQRENLAAETVADSLLG
jgi:hypothetical protein